CRRGPPRYVRFAVEHHGEAGPALGDEGDLLGVDGRQRGAEALGGGRVAAAEGRYRLGEGRSAPTLRRGRLRCGDIISCRKRMFESVEGCTWRSPSWARRRALR